MVKKQEHKITEKDFEKLELRIGTIKAVKKHENERDYILLVDLGPVGQDLQVVADLKESYTMNRLLGKQVVLITNIRHKLVGKAESQAMILVSTLKGKKRIISPDTNFLPGVKVHGLIDGTVTHREG